VTSGPAARAGEATARAALERWLHAALAAVEAGAAVSRHVARTADGRLLVDGEPLGAGAPVARRRRKVSTMVDLPNPSGPEAKRLYPRVSMPSANSMARSW